MSPKYFLSIIIVVLIALASCTQNVTEKPGIVASETSTPTKALSATPTLENTYRTPNPTLSIDTEQKMVEVLKSSDCVLPCYMGITPGVTKSSDAKILLERLGIRPVDEGISGMRYLIVIDDPSITMTNGAVEDHRIANSIGLAVKDDVVQHTYIWILGRGLSPKYQDYWSRYSPKGVFLQLGTPDKIYVGKGGTLGLVYERLGIINMYETFWKDGQLCPQNETVYFDRRFVIKNKDTSDALYTEFEDSLKNKALSNPIAESLGISVQEFYDQVIADDSVCFDIKR
jgi:hypothetical protein